MQQLCSDSHRSRDERRPKVMQQIPARGVRNYSGCSSSILGMSGTLPAHVLMGFRWKSWAVVLCAAMMLFITSAEASHFHDDGLPDTPFSKQQTKSSGTHCLLCSSLHSPAISSQVAVSSTTAIYSSSTVPATPTDPTRLEAFGLFVRPPPSMA